MKIRLASLVLLAGLLAGSAFAADRPTAATAVAAFTHMKGLVGNWRADTNMGKVQVSYELTSGGHVLLERISADSPKPHSMVTAFYLDGDTLALTHYCSLGNQPHMVARKIDLRRGEIVFDFAGAGNLATPDAQHMHSATFRLQDGDHFTASWTMFDKSQPEFTIAAQYARVK